MQLVVDKIKTKRAVKRLGRGTSSGKGKTAGRGQKGQKARGKVRLGFEGGQTPLYKRVPFLRGKGMRSTSIKPMPVNIEDLDAITAKGPITLGVLIEAGLITPKQARINGVKILGCGEITKAVTVALPVTESARQKIEQAGGKVEAKADHVAEAQPTTEPKAQTKPVKRATKKADEGTTLWR